MNLVTSSQTECASFPLCVGKPPLDLLQHVHVIVGMGFRVGIEFKTVRYGLASARQRESEIIISLDLIATLTLAHPRPALLWKYTTG